LKNAVVANNTVIKCGFGWNTGYGIFENVKIHHNVMYNCGYPSGSYPAALVMGASSDVKKSEYTDNTWIDDRSIPTPTGVAASLVAGGTLTSGTPYYYKVTALDDYGETLGRPKLPPHHRGVTLASP